MYEGCSPKKRVCKQVSLLGSWVFIELGWLLNGSEGIYFLNRFNTKLGKEIRFECRGPHISFMQRLQGRPLYVVVLVCGSIFGDALEEVRHYYLGAVIVFLLN